MTTHAPFPADFDSASVLEPYFSPSQRAAIAAATIGVAGAGGLGSNCAVALARSGFTRFVIADFDRVEPVNLNRQAYDFDQIGMPKVAALARNLRRINPALRISAVEIELDRHNLPVVFEDCTAVVEAFDSPEAKAMIVETFAGSGKLVVTASGLAGIGGSDRIVTRAVNADFYVIGDGESAVGERLKPYAPRVTVAAAKQADVVLQWVLARG